MVSSFKLSHVNCDITFSAVYRCCVTCVDKRSTYHGCEGIPHNTAREEEEEGGPASPTCSVQ